MEITAAQDYGVRLVLYLSYMSIYKDTPVVSRKRISEEMEISHFFLAKIAQVLQKKGIIIIMRGKKGGYKLAKPPSKISLLEVLEILGESPNFSKCIVDPISCKRSSFCPVNKVWKKLTNLARKILSNYTFDRLAELEFFELKKHESAVT